MATFDLFKLDSSKQHIWFTSGTHFGHDKIIKYCQRPFASANEMDETLIKNWNAVVKQEDIIFHLGDFAFGGSNVWNSVLDRLNGQIHLILGNHDVKNIRDNYMARFASVSFQKMISIDDHLIYLNHYPFLCYGGAYRKGEDAVLQLFGHVHSNPIKYDIRIILTNDNTMDINEKFFPQRMYFVEWNGGLKVCLRLNPTNFDIDTGIMPYAEINLIDCAIGENWKIKGEQSAIDEYNQRTKKWHSNLPKEYIEKNFILNKDDAISLSQERWKIYSPSGKSWDVVSYWDDCDRKVINEEPLEYKDAKELCRRYVDKTRYGSLYHYTVEPHKFKK